MIVPGEASEMGRDEEERSVRKKANGGQGSGWSRREWHPLFPGEITISMLHLRKREEACQNQPSPQNDV